MLAEADELTLSSSVSSLISSGLFSSSLSAASFFSSCSCFFSRLEEEDSEADVALRLELLSLLEEDLLPDEVGLLEDVLVVLVEALLRLLVLEPL